MKGKKTKPFLLPPSLTGVLFDLQRYRQLRQMLTFGKVSRERTIMTQDSYWDRAFELLLLHARLRCLVLVCLVVISNRSIDRY